METDHLETSSSSSVSAPNNLDIRDPSLIHSKLDNDVESLLEVTGNLEVDDEEMTWIIVKGANVNAADVNSLTHMVTIPKETVLNAKAE